MGFHARKHNCKICVLDTGSEDAAKFINLKKYTDNCQLLNPPTKFLEYVIKAGKVFEEVYKGMEHQNKLIQNLSIIIKSNIPTYGCVNFPTDFFINLFARMRIYHILKKKNCLLKTKLGRQKLKNLI